MSEGTRKLEGMRNAFRRWAKRLFHRSDKRRSNHSTSDQPLNKTSHPPQETSTLGTGTNSKVRQTAPNWPLTTDSHQPPGTLDAQTTAHGSQVTDASISNNQPQSLGKPQGTQQGYLKPALKRKAVNQTPPQGSAHNHHEAKAHSRDEHADSPVATGSDNNNAGVGHQGHYTDHSVHPRPAVVHEEIEPHVHTVYEPTRTRSFHLHEHRTLVQPIVDPAAR